MATSFHRADAGKVRSVERWGETPSSPDQAKAEPGGHHFTFWFQANGPWDQFAMNLFSDDAALPAISVKAHANPRARPQVWPEMCQKIVCDCPRYPAGTSHIAPVC